MLQNTQFDNRAIVRYSNAYYSIGLSRNTETFDEIEKLLQLFEKSKDFDTLFNSPLLNKKQQTEIVLKLFSGNKKKIISVSKDMLGLMTLLAKNSKLHILEAVLKRCLDLKISNNKEVKITVTSVIKLSDDVIVQLKKIFSKSDKVNVKIVNLIDENMLGGLILQVGSNLIDMSVRSKLNKINSAMKGAN